MKILADENIPLVHNFFDSMGEVSTFEGRHLTPEQLGDAEILLVRSITRVDEALLQDSKVRFVGTCTIGHDHIDKTYLDAQKIGFAHAPGCNANSVVEYVLSCLSVLTERNGLDLDHCCVGIVGFGNVGSLLGSKLDKLGIDFKYYDPLREEPSGYEQHQVEFEEILNCDVISLHTPLTYETLYPTFHMFDSEILGRLSSEQILINTGRGAVIDNKALYLKLSDHQRFTVILDVWENEPLIHPGLAQKVAIATPHIAGYSLDGKVAGTEMVYQALCQFLGLPVRHKAGQFMPEPPLSKLTFTSQADVDWAVHTAIRACFDVRHDHCNFKATFCLDEEERALKFDEIRRHYRNRREFSNIKINLKKTDSELYNQFKALGFNVKT